MFLKYPIVNYIKLPRKYVDEVDKKEPDIIWFYQEELSRVVKQFPNHQRIHLGPDTESLYYYRMLGRRFVMNNVLDYWKCALMYRKYARMEKEYCTDKNFAYYAVGEEDVRHLQQLNPNVMAKFLRHPHYEVKKHNHSPSPEDDVIFCEWNKKFHQPKIKLLIAGRYDLYMKQEADELNSQFIIHNSQLKEHYMLTFLGKGWEKHVETLRDVGYEVDFIKFAPDYIEEICKHDIQVTPIAIGTGTKGKVLDALANGLLVIGTPYALENIAVSSGKSCIVYQQKEVIDVLLDIPNNIQNYEHMAEEGRRQVLNVHDRKRVSKQLFAPFNEQ